MVMPLGKKWANQNLCKTENYGSLVLKMNEAIKTFVLRHSTRQSPITIVDLYTGMDADKNMYDDIHPNDKGEAFVAERYYNAIRKYLTKL